MVRQSTTGKLAAVTVKQSKTKDKPYKLSDGGGLYLLVNPNGSKYWRLKYRLYGMEKVLALGVYPTVSMIDARRKTQAAKELIDKNVDPVSHKKQSRVAEQNDLFKHIAKDWHQKESGAWAVKHADDVWKTISDDVLPYLGDIPIQSITTRNILSVVKRVEKRGALVVASRVKQRIGAIYNYAIQIGRAELNPVTAMANVIEAKKTKQRKALKQDQLPAFLNALDNYSGYAVTKYALQLIAITFVRPGELRKAEWSEFDLDKAVWRIPADKMKMGEEHIVPLSQQAVEILERVRVITGSSNYVFPGISSHKKPMSENTLTNAIRKRLEFDATAHGFRTTASTILNEAGYRVDVIERQLAHGERNKVRATYNKASYLAERTAMMQWYSDLLSSLKAGADVVPIKKAH
jgi:integrase